MASVQVTWFQQVPHLIHLEFPDRWEDADFEQASDHVRVLLDASDHRVDLLVDLRNNTKIPNNAMGMFNSLFSLNPARTGMILFITHTSFQRSMVHIIQRTNARIKRQVLLISTPDEIAKLRGSNASDL